MFHCVYVPLLSYPFVCRWTSRLLPCPGYYKQCCDEHWGTRVSFNSGFLGVYAQQWDCWVIWQFCFQFFKESPHPHDYIIGRGDLLSVEVFEVPELSRDVRVSQTGNIGLPLIPTRLQMLGLTETQAARKIGEVLESSGLVSHPQVSVTVKEKKSKPITIVG